MTAKEKWETYQTELKLYENGILQFIFIFWESYIMWSCLLKEGKFLYKKKKEKIPQIILIELQQEIMLHIMKTSASTTY